MDIGSKIDAIREAKNISKNELARLAGLSRSGLINVLQNIKSPSIDTLRRICDALDIPISDIFNDENDNNIIDDPQNSNIFSKTLKSLREYRGYRPQEIAKKAGVDISTYNKYENGKSEPDYIILCRLADVFNVTTDYLMGRAHTGEIAAAHIDGGKSYEDLSPEALQQLEEYRQFLILKYGKKQ